jgi:glycosyltransferase involved in cell wall biosynthesis
MKISILIAAYNVEEFIEKCIISCCNQDLDKNLFEIIVVNDGSTDSTLSILNNLKKSITNLVVINQVNSGLGAARNTALLNAKGKYIWFIDGDDFIKENILNKIINEIEEHELNILVLDYAIVNQYHEIIKTNANELKNFNEICSGSEFYSSNFEKSYTVLFIFENKLFELNNLFFKERINMQDSEILPKILLHTNRISFLKSVAYYYVQHENSFTNSTNGKKRYEYFSSIIEVRNSLIDFQNQIQYLNPQLYMGLEKKINALHHIIFNHLLFFKYEKKWLLEILKLLKTNNLYPLQYDARGKFLLLKILLNNFPLTTKWFIDLIQKARK